MSNELSREEIKERIRGLDHKIRDEINWRNSVQPQLTDEQFDGLKAERTELHEILDKLEEDS
jgi:hypothetical protein